MEPLTHTLPLGNSCRCAGCTPAAIPGTLEDAEQRLSLLESRLSLVEQFGMYLAEYGDTLKALRSRITDLDGRISNLDNAITNLIFHDTDSGV